MTNPNSSAAYLDDLLDVLEGTLDTLKPLAELDMARGWERCSLAIPLQARVQDWLRDLAEGRVELVAKR